MLKLTNVLTSAATLMIIAFAGLTVSVPAHAATLIDPNFAVCGTSALTSSCSGDPNPLDSSGNLYAGVIGGGTPGPLDPFLLLVAVPSAPSPLSASSPVFANPGSYTPGSGSLTISAATTQMYGQKITVGAGGLLSGSFSTTDNLFSFADLATTANNSFNFANMIGSAESTILNNVTPTSFSVYEFVVSAGSTGNLSTDNIYTIPYTSMPLGSYVGAYGLECYPITSSCKHVYDSAFTVSGWVDGSPPLPPASVPEPGTLALLGISLAALGLSRSRWMGRLGSARVV